MARSRRKSRARPAASSRGRGWRWLALALGLGVLLFITRAPIERAARELDSLSGYKRVESYAPLLREVAASTKLDPNLLAGIMLAESSGRVDAVSSAGALGLFQLMLPTARERAQLLGLSEPTRADLLRDAELNMRLAAHYLRWLERRYAGQLEPMLIAYNAGPGRLDGWIKEHGTYVRWRATRERAGDSQVLAYAAKIARYRARFAERGVIAPRYDHPPSPSSAPPVLASEVRLEPSASDTARNTEIYGPVLPPAPHVVDVPAPSAAPPR